ncbi:MAG: outer-membrane lipoprotein carrier protein LolA [Ignavibacteriaceae bacterium]|jgi:outer membrane lipoprotein-sorting protein|nr:outer-membrane lipoprotein carrier protein LolA [Ignavibacteriaceae bacterium]MCU0405732.1 outer-membrane lipoprotein carrier protein LolA [Ignavibacteriaceae bacterium]MCU0413935.1 outer-membrane lipoprotein carrier protein LolA [Ignavibacteriaceae bacterium]
MLARLLLLTILISFSVSIAQNNANEVLKNIQDKFNSIADLSAQITQSVNDKVNLNGKVFYKKENQLRFEFDNMVIISDGETSWNYNKKQDKVIITDYDTEGNKILSIRQIIYDYPEDCTLNTFESEGKQVLELIPKDATISYSSVKLFINTENLITKVLVDDPATGIIQIDLSNYQLNKNLPDSYFSFTAPEGSQVLDLR